MVEMGIIIGILLLIVGTVLFFVGCHKDDRDIIIFLGILSVGMGFVCLHDLFEQILK